jgi:Abnormal spindle-like microcephaly-assoc'd, ASPM-SPD-2-Hydin
MRHLPARWNALAVVLALAGMLGCQGLSTSKPNSQGTQTPLPGALSATPASISFLNVRSGSDPTESDTLTNTGGTSLTITQASVTGTGFSISGLSLPLTLAPNQSATFSVIFTLQSAGSASGNLALTNDGASSPVNVALSGTAVAAGSLTATPASFTFGNVQVGTNQTQTETLKNSGGENITVSAASFTGPGFSYSGLSLPLTLVPNQSTTFGVVFAPTTAGASNGSLSISESGSSTAFDIGASGTGVTPAMLTATPTSLTFTNVQVGQTQTQTETVKNTGGMNATISQAVATGTGFSISGLSAPLTLTPGQSASFSVNFAPQSSGSFSGSVAIASNASDPSLSAGLSGSAIAQSQGTLNVSAVNVGSVTVGTSGTQTGTLSATGASVSVSSVGLSGTNPSEFAISGLSFPVTVTTTQPVAFTVTFTPGATGAASASASFTSAASNSPTAATVTGTGTAAPVHTVSLSWKASTTSGVTSYNIYRAVYGTSSCGSYSSIGSTPSPTTLFTDNVVADGTTYCYATTAVDPSGESGYSNIIQAKIPAP